ncbi:PadR family transcriptional regulator [Halobacteriales archaeon QS_4_69_225]|nr:MAG: PadR family transcriptional regulator [Halobacteriales archaeon QS_4_69_225]
MSSNEDRLVELTDDGAVSRLHAELDDAGAGSGAVVSELAAAADRSLFTDGFAFEEERVKGSLDELLVTLVGARTSETHGQQLIEDLSEEFDTRLSPGTVYPRLHDLCDEGLLEQRELVRTKEYEISDEEAARELVSESARQHIALGLAFQAALEDGDFS